MMFSTAVKMKIFDKKTAKLICVFVFAYAKIRFSHDAAHITKMQIIIFCVFNVLFTKKVLSGPLGRRSISSVIIRATTCENLLFCECKNKGAHQLISTYIVLSLNLPKSDMSSLWSFSVAIQPVS